MLSNLGLRSRMAASYMLVSAAAVILVEAALLLVMMPRVRAADQAAREAEERAVQAEQSLNQATVQRLANDLASAVGKVASVAAEGAPHRADHVLIVNAAPGGFQKLAASVPGRVMVQVLADVNGRVVAADPQNAYQPNSDLPSAVRAAPTAGRTGDKLRVWATMPIQTVDAGGAAQRTIGLAYVELGIILVPTGGTGSTEGTPAADGIQAKRAGKQPNKGPFGDRLIASVVLPGVVTMLLLIPVGPLFGLLSTGRLVRRIERLSDVTSVMADGDLHARVPVSGRDEVSRLEQAFNSMAERLKSALADQRAAAGAEARRAERGRIARELHDSISQDLFSVSLVAAGMRKALSPGSALQEEAESMERSLARTMREMRALLMELRPIQLEDAGLLAAVDGLCRAYEARLGIPIRANLDPVRLDAEAEHAVLRVVQEAVGNAIRHGEPSSIEVRLVAAGERVEVMVRDDGRGFDLRTAGGRHGMGLGMMRERLREVGGVVEFDTAPEHGTTVRVTLPARAGEPVG